MTHKGSSAPGAIQIIKSVDNEHQGDKQQIIRLVEKYKDGPCLKDVLCGENKDLPIFIISICGKTRTGKSFLLNLMVKYLQSKEYEDWTEGVLPSVFEWKKGSQSVTKGLWICSKVFKLKNQNGKQVGVLLLDNQGLFDGEQTDGVSIAISGISTTLSFYQIFNVKEKICENDLESIWRHLIPDEVDLLSEGSSTKLVFTVRDYLDEELGCGLDHGKVYLETDANRGSPAHKKIWKELKNTFPDTSCLLLPYPGEAVRVGSVKDMQDIHPSFLQEIGVFFSKMFDPKNLNATTKTSTGQIVYETLKKFDGKVADESLSFVNVFTEQGNQNKFEFLLKDFEHKMESFCVNPLMGKSLIQECMTVAKKKFKGKSSNDFLLQIEKLMKDKINLTLRAMIVKGYETSFKQSSDASYRHSLEWDSVEKRLSYFVGSESEQKNMKEKVIMECADLFYTTVRKELSPRFEYLCKHKTLEGLQGFDERFLSEQFKENDDFKIFESTRQACRAIWLRERELLHLFVQDKLLTYVAALTEIDKEWLQNATKTQFKFYEIFTWNDSHHIKIAQDDNCLLELIAYAMYKNTQELCRYSKDQKEAFSQIAEQIKNKSSRSVITLTCIFVLYRHEGEDSCEPVFKVLTESGYYFIDIKSRAYKDWESYEADNKLPACLYCHPAGGEYNKKRGFQIAFTWSPASTFTHKFLKLVDVAAKIGAIGSAAALGAVVAFPALSVAAVGGAITAGITGGWGILRGIFNISDKVGHDVGVDAKDVVEMVANSLSVTTAGITGGAVLLTTIGREIACAPAIIQGISSLTNLVFQLDRENISYLSLANDISMFLLFNSKSVNGAITNIKTSYGLPAESSNLDTFLGFINKNSVTFPKADGPECRWKTEQFLSESLKSLLLTAIMNKIEERPLNFLRGTVNAYEDLKPLQTLFGKDSREELKLVEELIALVGNVIQNKRDLTTRVGRSYQFMNYHPTTEVNSEVALAGVCTGLTTVAECSKNECVQQICLIAREILKFVYENAETTDLQGLIAYLKNNSSKVVKKIKEIC